MGFDALTTRYFFKHPPPQLFDWIIWFNDNFNSQTLGR